MFGETLAATAVGVSLAKHMTTRASVFFYFFFGLLCGFLLGTSLVPFQKILLSFSVSCVTITQELVNSYSGLLVGFVVGVLEGEFLEFCELTFDPVEPGCIRGRPDQGDLVLPCPTHNLSSFVG